MNNWLYRWDIDVNEYEKLYKIIKDREYFF
jgi:hypothetical protein